MSRAGRQRQCEGGGSAGGRREESSRSLRYCERAAALDEEERRCRPADLPTCTRQQQSDTLLHAPFLLFIFLSISFFIQLEFTSRLDYFGAASIRSCAMRNSISTS